MGARPVPELLAQQIDHVPIDAIAPHPKNPNEGDVGAIDESVDALGGKFYQVIFVQRSTGQIIAGEHRWRELQMRGSPVAPVVYLDVDDEQAQRIRIGDNEIPRKRSRARDDVLVELLLEMQQQSDVGLAGTGYDDADLDALIASTTPPPFDPEREQQFIQPTSAFRATIHFRDEKDRDAFFASIDRAPRTSLWWPVEDDQ